MHEVSAHNCGGNTNVGGIGGNRVAISICDLDGWVGNEVQNRRSQNASKKQ